MQVVRLSLLPRSKGLVYSWVRYMSVNQNYLKHRQAWGWGLHQLQHHSLRCQHAGDVALHPCPASFQDMQGASTTEVQASSSSALSGPDMEDQKLGESQFKEEACAVMSMQVDVCRVVKRISSFGIHIVFGRKQLLLGKVQKGHMIASPPNQQDTICKLSCS